LIQSTSKTDAFNSPDRFGLPTCGFLIFKLSTTSNEIPPFFLFFSSDEDDFFNLKLAFGLSIEP
jgi:hypothetical protein